MANHIEEARRAGKRNDEDYWRLRLAGIQVTIAEMKEWDAIQRREREQRAR